MTLGSHFANVVCQINGDEFAFCFMEMLALHANEPPLANDGGRHLHGSIFWATINLFARERIVRRHCKSTIFQVGMIVKQF